jgi:hypothetical protein
MKFVPTRLVKAHYGTFVDARTETVHLPDFVVALVPPLLAGAGVIIAGLNVNETVSGGVLTASGLFAAFLFGAMLQVSARAVEWVDRKPKRGPQTTQTATNLEELAANAGYASLMAVLAAVFFLVCSATKGQETINTVALAFGVAIGLHMIIMLVMVMNRVFLMTQSQLIEARTGGGSGEIMLVDDREQQAS